MIQLGVDGGRGLGAVPQQLSDLHQGRAPREEIAGDRVPQSVRADPRRSPANISLGGDRPPVRNANIVVNSDRIQQSTDANTRSVLRR